MFQIHTFGYLNESTHFLYNNMLDTRAGGMGNTYIGLSDTLIGAYYNPAGLAYIEQNRITESSNSFKSTSFDYKNTATNFSYNQKLTSSIPPFFGFFQNFDDLNVAFSIITPKSNTINKDNLRTITLTSDDGVDFDYTYYENYDAKNTQILIGPSVATKLNETLSIGASFFYSYQTRDYIQNVYSYLTASPDTLKQWNNSYNDETIHELLGIFGVQWMPTDKLSLGSKVNIPYSLSGSGTEQRTESTLNNASEEYTSSIIKQTYDLEDLGFRSNYPQIGIGASYFYSPETLISVDLNYLISYPSSSTFPTKDTLNIGVGIEHYLSPMIPARFGLYTNNSFLESNADGEHIDAMGLSGTIGYEFGANKFNAGFDFQWGTGSYKQDGIKTLDLDYSGITFIISASTSI